MKKFIILIAVFCIIICNFVSCTNSNDIKSEEKIYNYEEVKEKLIRFHVIANSDSEEDQNLKLKVKDEVVKYLYDYLKDSESLEESRNIILNNQEKVNNIAKEVIKREGYSYNIYSKLSIENFPEKEYGSIILPQGEYEAFRIIIGEGQGKNWWCVMFPPLCFIDITKGQVNDKKSMEVLDEEIKETKEEKVKIKSKFLEVIEDIFD